MVIVQTGRITSNLCLIKDGLDLAKGKTNMLKNFIRAKFLLFIKIWIDRSNIMLFLSCN
jgi:hypothetical protein